MTSNESSTQGISRNELKGQIEAMLKFLPVPTDDFGRASVENNKLILIEDFAVEEDAEFKNMIMSYVPQAKEVAAPKV